MEPANRLGKSGSSVVGAESRFARDTLHPAWRAFVRYCAELQHGEIEVLKIQNGLPVLAEVTRKKVKFTP
jgi:hypothetical protein